MRYCFKVEEITRKYVWVEADNKQEAEALAIEIPDELLEDEDEDDYEDIISDYISDETGFCHYGFELEV